MADCQLGAFASFSGMGADDVVRYAAQGMRVHEGPLVEGFEWDADRYAEAIAAANNLRPEFVVMGGDMVDDPASEEQLEALLRITSRLDTSIPMFWVPGNHDIAADTVHPTSHSIDKYREVFGPDYYAFDRGVARFLVLDTVVIDSPDQVPDELEEQMAWFDWEVERACEEQKEVILFGHHPLFLTDAAEPDSYWNLPSERRKHLLDVVHRGRIKIAFAGHWHRNSIARDGDFEMVTSGPVGYPLGEDPSGLRLVSFEGQAVTHRYAALADLSARRKS
ncbi:MAG: metallophosphoesterase [Acidimicrobiia bacterium]|nr:metallophosphoesterase [Acidimicrobiia bacterium]